MTTSLLTTRRDAIFAQMMAKLADAGYAYDPLTTSLDRYLATALAGLAGGTNLYKTRGRSRLLADLVTALGGSGNVLTQSELALVAEIVDASGGGPAPYHADAVHFDGSTYVSIASVTSTDNSKFTGFGWIKCSTRPIRLFAFPFDFDPANLEIAMSVYADGSIQFQFTQAAAAGTVYTTSATGVFPFDTNWHSLLFSLDTSVMTGDPSGIALYMDRIQVALPGFWNNSIPSFASSGVVVGIPDTPDDFPPLTGDVANLSGWLGTSIVQSDGTILGADLDNFLTIANKPVNPSIAVAAYGTPLLRFDGVATVFGTNQGNAGSASTTGTLTNASTSPSD